MNYEKMTEEILRRRDEIRRQKKKDALRLVAAMSVTWVMGTFIGTGIHTAFLKNDASVPPAVESITAIDDSVGAESSDENIILSHKPNSNLNCLALPNGYTSSWNVDDKKLGGKKTIVIGDKEIQIYYNYSVEVKKE